MVIIKSFLNDCSPQWSSYSLCIKLCLLNINNISKGHIGSLGGRCSILDLLFWERGVSKFKLPYNYSKMISLQNVMGKIINDIITFFLFNILKLLCSNCFVHLSYFPTSTSVLNGLVRPFESNCTWIYIKLDLTFFYFSSYLCFTLLYFMSEVKYWSKVGVDLEFWNTTHFVF